MKKPLFLLMAALLQVFVCNAQNLPYVRSCIDSLASPRFQGRGYVNNGDKIAANFISGQLKDIGIKHWGDSYFQPFTLSTNTFPGKIELKVNNKLLKPGYDFLVALSSPSVSGTFKTIWLNGNSFKKEKDILAFRKKDLSKIVLIIDTSFHDFKNPLLYKAGMIMKTTCKTLVWDAADGLDMEKFAFIDVARDKLPGKCRKLSVNIESLFRKDYQTQNVIGYIPGTQYPDSFFVFIGHYDHLGRMGAATYFPGAHDNASGTAMLLDLAKFYAMPENRQPYSIAFIFMSGEEAGLLGSDYYTKNPLFPLKQIKFLINLDMESTGSEGIKVVNGSVYKDIFDRLVRLNDEKHYLKTISPRGEAANSDHYRFYKKGVKCFYIYTLGDEWKAYHSPADVSTGLPMTKYEDLFRLVTAFIGELEKK